MKLTCPHMGYLNTAIYTMLDHLGIEFVEAPPITKRTLELGSLHSPEGACLPYKINMGNYIESIDRGVDTVVTLNATGKCRFGFYPAVQKLEMQKLSSVNFLTINTDHFFRELYRFLRKAAPNAGSGRIIKSIALAVKMLNALDSIHSAKIYYGVRSSAPAEIIRLYNQGIEEMRSCRTFGEINHRTKAVIEKIQAACDHHHDHPITVGLVGEFYVLLEPRINLHIEDFLLKEGIGVKKFVYTGEWAYANTLLKTLGLYNEEKDQRGMARPYLNYHVGGEGLRSVGSAVWFARNGFDGIVHVYPFGCMPEGVAQYALKEISADFDIPILSLSIDEHSSAVGFVTRFEAFADCLKRRKKQ